MKRKLILGDKVFAPPQPAAPASPDEPWLKPKPSAGGFGFVAGVCACGHDAAAHGSLNPPMARCAYCLCRGFLPPVHTVQPPAHRGLDVCGCGHPRMHHAGRDGVLGAGPCGVPIGHADYSDDNIRVTLLCRCAGFFTVEPLDPSPLITRARDICCCGHRRDRHAEAGWLACTARPLCDCLAFRFDPDHPDNVPF